MLLRRGRRNGKEENIKRKQPYHTSAMSPTTTVSTITLLVIQRRSVGSCIHSLT